MSAFHFDTILISCILGLGNMSMAQDVKFQDQVMQLYLNKKRPMTVDLTQTNPPSQLKIYTNPKVDLPADKFKIKPSGKQGGVSGGGGNAVGNVLFDFYEAQGAIDLTIEELVSVEPLVLEKIDLINRNLFSPHTSRFFDYIKFALSQKKIVFDPKTLVGHECINKSMVSSSLQKIQACQSKTQVRFNLNWLMDSNTSSINRAGLIFHEILLAYISSIYPNLDISDPELNERVRFFNVDLFNDNLSSAQLLDSFNKYLGMDDRGTEALSTFELQEIRTAKIKISEGIRRFCADHNYDLVSYFKSNFLNTDKIYSNLPINLQNAYSKVKSLSYIYKEELSAKNPSKFMMETFQDEIKKICN